MIIARIRTWLKSGTVLVIVMFVCIGAGWFLYRQLIPQAWLHALAADIALRGTPDPNARPPRDARQATPRDSADHSYICLAKIIPFSWDKFVVVPSGGDPRTVVGLENAVWQDDKTADYASRMAKDPQYQLIIFLDQGRVVAEAPFFTFWGDLSALNLPSGFTQASAVFTSAVKDGHYVLMPVEPPYPAVCY